jgi:hypothetical protein
MTRGLRCRTVSGRSQAVALAIPASLALAAGPVFPASHGSALDLTPSMPCPELFQRRGAA